MAFADEPSRLPLDFPFVNAHHDHERSHIEKHAGGKSIIRNISTEHAGGGGGGAVGVIPRCILQDIVPLGSAAQKRAH